MADLKEFQVGNIVYNLKDETARNSISALQAAVGSPLVANLVASMTDTTKIYVYTGSETGYTNGHWYYYNGSAWTDGGTYQSAGIGAGTVNGSKLSDDLKASLLALFRSLAYTVINGQDLYEAFYASLYPPADLESISAVYTQSGTVFDTDSLDVLRSDLVVTAHYDNGTTSTVSNYALSGTLAEGTSTITATYGGKTTTFNVTVTADDEFVYGLANLSNSVTGSYITDTGTIESATSDSGYYEEYVDVHQLSSFLIHAAKATMSSGVIHRISVYDANKVFTRQLVIRNTNYISVTLNSGEKYIRVGWYSTTIPTYYIESTSPASLIMEVGDINGTTGENSSSTVRVRSVGYIPASGSITVEDCPWGTWTNWAGATGGGYFFRCYDASYNIVGTLIGSNNTMYRNDISQISLPSGTAYVRMVLQKTGSTTTISSGFTANTHPFAINGTSYQVAEA